MIEIRHSTRPSKTYDQIYQGSKIRQMESFFIWICKLLDVKPGDRLLDISTGRGQMVKIAQSLGIDAYGLDFSMRACEIACEQAPKPTIFCANGASLPIAKNNFKFVTVLGSLEHFDNMERGAQEVARVLNPGGKACITVPNTFGLRWNVNVAWRTGDVDDDGQPIQRYGTLVQWKQLLNMNGLRVDDVLGYEHELAFPRTKNDFFYYLTRPSRLIRLILTQFLPVSMAGQFVFLCSLDKT